MNKDIFNTDIEEFLKIDEAVFNKDIKEFLKIDEDIEYTIKDIEEFLKINENESKKEKLKIMQKLLKVQDKIKIFKNIDPLELKTIVYGVKFLRTNFKECIIEQGKTSQNIYYIIDGGCHVFLDGHKIGELHPGDSFGESGAIFGEKRNATVICSKKSSSFLSFKIDQENLDFCSKALAILYKNLAFEINAKLTDLNKNVVN